MNAELRLCDGRLIYRVSVPEFVGTLDLIVWEGRVFERLHSPDLDTPQYRERFAWFAPRPDGWPDPPPWCR